MMWNTITIIGPEFVPIIVGCIYLFCVALLKKISPQKIILFVLILLTLAPISIVAYVYLFSATYIAQGLIFIEKKERIVAYKYFVLAFLSTLTCLDPILPQYKIVLLTIALAQIVFTSEKTESQNTYLYISNLTLLTGLVLKIQPIYNQDFSSLIIIISLLIVCLRTLILKTSTILTIVPIIILTALFSEKIILVSVFIYSVYLVLLINTQKYRLALLILLLLPFIDFSVFNIAFMDVLNKNLILNNFYVLIVVIALVSLCVAKILEIEFKNKKLSFSYKTILLSLFPALLIVIKTIETGSAYVSTPVPLVAVIPFIVIEARYLSLLNRISLSFNFKTPELVGYCFRWIHTATKLINIKKPNNFLKKIINNIDIKTLKLDYTVLLSAIILITVTIIILIYTGAL